jgi:hypothetical protein
MLVPILPPVVPILFHPALLGVTLVITVLRIIFHLFSLPTSFPNTLAILFVTVSVIMDMRVWKKKTSASRIGTSDLLVHDSPPVETINLFEAL